MALSELSLQLKPTSPPAVPITPFVPSTPSGPDHTVNKKKMYLAKLQLPNFNGDILQWQSFRDLFNASVLSVLTVTEFKVTIRN